MPTYTARGSITLKGTKFRIVADNIDAARRKAREGDFAEFESDSAELVDWEIDSGSVEAN